VKVLTIVSLKEPGETPIDIKDTKEENNIQNLVDMQSSTQEEVATSEEQILKK
jgi:hypothetical protein